MSAADSCPFCTTVLPDPSCWLYANVHAVAFFDRYPSAPGHVLVIPRVHVSHVLDLSRAEFDAVLDLALRCRADLTAADATIGVNDGPAAGQTVPHMHMHVIPRTLGDHPDPRGGLRWVLPETAAYFKEIS